jgi:protein SCO1/2
MPETTRRSLLRYTALAPFAGVVLAEIDSTAKNSEAATKPTSPREAARARYFPNVSLTTHEGKRVRFYDDVVKGKIVTLNFMYANCAGICPTVTANLVEVQKLLGKRVGTEIFMYSLTLKPEEDTPAVLKKYMAAHGLKPGWTFLTGKPDDIELLRRSLGFVDPDPVLDKDKSSHIGNIRYGNEPLMIWAACPGMAHPHWIAESILFADPNWKRPSEWGKKAVGTGS